MNGAENIKETILGEGKKEAEAILNQTRKEIDGIKGQQKKDEEKFTAQSKEDSAKAVELLQDKTLAQARLHAKRNLLIEREKIISDIVEDAVKGIDHGSKAYEKFLKKIIDDNSKALSGSVKVLCNKKDVKVVKGFDGEYEVGEVDIAGGVILEDGEGKRIYESLRVQVEKHQDKIRKAIAKKLG